MLRLCFFAGFVAPELFVIVWLVEPSATVAFASDAVAGLVGWLAGCMTTPSHMCFLSSAWWPDPSVHRYDGPLEYLTMWLCLFLSGLVLERLQALQNRRPGVNWGGLVRLRQELSSGAPIHPHPLDVLKKL